MQRTIWQYWETRGIKPAFVDGLHVIAQRNSGCQVTLVTPGTLSHYLPNLPPSLLKIGELAHKADMIRTMLVAQHGGMWLDSDAIVLKDLNWIFDLLDTFEFVGFNDESRLQSAPPWIRVNCFASRPGGSIITEWVRQQHAKFPRTAYGWEEIGTELLHPICLARAELVKVLPFDLICPIRWNEVEKFMTEFDAGEIIERCPVVMLSNASLQRRIPQLRRMTCQDIAAQGNLVGAVMRAALKDDSVDNLSVNNRSMRGVLRSIKRVFTGP